MTMAGWMWLTLIAVAATGLLHPAGTFQTVSLLVYLLLGVNLLLGVAIGVSWISTSASLVLTETISSAICSPIAVIAELKIEVLHLVPNAPDCLPAPPPSQPPAWLKQLLMLSLMASSSCGLTDLIGLLCYVLYRASRHVVLLRWPAAGYDKETIMTTGYKRTDPHVTRAGGLGLGALVVVCGGLLSWLLQVPPTRLALSMAYCLLSDKLFMDPVSKLDFGVVHDDLGGQEEEVAKGCYLLGEATIAGVLVLQALLNGRSLVLISLLLSVLLPLRALWCRVLTPLRDAQRTLEGYRRASWRQIRNYNDVCAICLSALRCGRVTPCQHLFHAKCLRRSLQEKKVCPMCNGKLALNAHT